MHLDTLPTEQHSLEMQCAVETWSLLWRAIIVQHPEKAGLDLSCPGKDQN
jgi:hypothetical protein